MIGIFDSGLGGLSIAQAIYKKLPQASILYCADHAFLPYGTKDKQELVKRSVKITQFLLGNGAKIIVIACNTATAAAINDLRKTFTTVPFVGVEPPTKPALGGNSSDLILIAATKSTLKSDRFQKLIKRFKIQNHIILKDFPHWVTWVEEGRHNQRDIKKLVKTELQQAINPNGLEKINKVVLGCTHYLFYQQFLQELLPQATIFNPADAVATQVMQLYSPDNKQAKQLFFTTGKASLMQKSCSRLLSVVARVQSITL